MVSGQSEGRRSAEELLPWPVPEALAAGLRGSADVAPTVDRLEVLVQFGTGFSALLTVFEYGRSLLTSPMQADRVMGPLVGEPPVGDLKKSID